MDKSEAVSQMVRPGQKRPGKWMQGVMQIHLTRACDLACSNCTQGSQFGGKNSFMDLDNFDDACQSLQGYFGLIGIFGGNPALHPRFDTICEILRSYFPQERCGIWCNHPRGKAAEMRRTFNPAMSNLNVHLVREAHDEFKRDWPESRPFGLNSDSRHSPVHGNLSLLVPNEAERWRLISQCDINRHWSAMVCQFRGELRGFFCEIAGGQAVLNQDDPNYPDTGIPILRNHHWWDLPIEDYSNQIEYHCHRCLVPLRGRGALAQNEQVSSVTEDIKFKPKGKHLLTVLSSVEEVSSESSRRVIDYLGR